MDSPLAGNSPLDPPADPDFAAFRDAVASRYAIGREIGRGGMSRVYLAEDLRHKRRVAVKVLPSDLDCSLSRGRFAREIEIAAGFTHPNILALYDSGEAAGRQFFAMPYVEGQSLRDLLRERGRLELDAAVAIACELADALQHAHAQQVVHRDLKPENILLVEGRPLLADFGIALVKSAAAQTRLTTRGEVVGTHAYMSPEQATPGREVDGRADIYSLGIVLHEMLTGSVPTIVPGTGQGEWRVVLTGGSGRSGGRRPVAPRAIERAIRRAVMIEPAMRFATAAEFAAALRGGGRGGVRPWIIGAIAASMVATAGAVGAWRTRAGDPPAPSPLSPRRVVVAQLDNPSARAELDYLGVMAADWLTEGLQRTGVVEVVPTPTALQSWRFARGAADPVRVLAQETGAGVVITGSYYAVANGEVAIQVQVSDVATRKLLGAVGPVRGSLATPTDAVETVRSRVMGLLASALDARIAAAPDVARRPPTFEAYREFSEALQDYVDNDFAAAARRFTRAWERDTGYVSALLMASISRSNGDDFAGADSLLEALAPRREQLGAADRHWFDYRRSLLAGRRGDALVSVRRLAAASPGTKATYNLAVEAMQNGALAEARRAIESLPGDRGPMRGWAQYWDVRARIDHLLGDHAAEREAADSARVLFPQRRFVLAATVRAMAAQGRAREIERALAAARRMPADPYGITPTALALEAAAELRAHGFAAAATPVLLQALAWENESGPARAPDARGRLARAQIAYALGQWREARDVATTLAAEQPANADYLGLAGAAAARAGDQATAERFAGQLAALPRRYRFGRPSVNEARIAAVLGERERAVALLRQAVAEGHEKDLWLHRDPDFASLRGTPEFDQLVTPRSR